MKKLFIIIIICIFANICACVQKDEVLHKKVDSLSLQTKTIYLFLEQNKIGKIDSLPTGEYNVLIWKKK